MSEKYNEQGIKACCANCEWCDKNGYKCKRSGAFVEKFEFCTYYHGPGQTPQMVIDELKKHERTHHDDIERLELALEASEKRIAELQKELNIVQESERAEAQEADKLREEVQNLKKENERLSQAIIDLCTGTLAEKNYQSTIKQIQNPSESFYQKYSGVSEEYALGALEQCATEADELQARVKDLESKLTETVKLLGERSRECGELEAYNEVLQRRVQEFSMELLDRMMKENKDVLQRLKKGEE